MNKKLLKNPMEKNKFYQKTKVQKLGDLKKNGWKNLTKYIKCKTLNHIIIYNPIFSLVNN
jgi:hypothetical protein